MNPLTVNGHKFHLRVYVLCVGALQVYVNYDILMLLAAHRYYYPLLPLSDSQLSPCYRYTTEDLEDSLAHLSNTARGIEDENFDEEKFVMVGTLVFLLINNSSSWTIFRLIFQQM